MSDRETTPGHREAIESADTVAAHEQTLTDPGGAERRAAAAPPVADLREAGAGEYEIETEIARGGMGRILRARDHRHRRVVALKEMLGISAASRARFEREALITARLQHPGIVPVYELARWRSGEPFYSMKLVEGRTLSDAIKAAGTASERLALLPKVIAAVDAIAYAHQQRVIHRDLKPSNILVGGFGETVVVDWGLAKDLDSADEPEDDAPASTDSDLTQAGSVMGTPVYMPVEQARGEALDERADVYALGAILYHLIAGVPPYRARSADDVLEQVLEKPPVKLSELDVDVPDDLIAIVEVAMARDREQRYPSGVELAAELERFSTGQLVGAHRYSMWSLFRRWVRRHRAVVITALIGVAALAAVSAFMVREILAERDAARQARAEAENQRQRAEGLVDFMLADLQDKLAPSGQMALLANVAERAGDYADQLPDGTVESVERRRRVAELLGDVRSSGGDLEAAEQAYRTELELAAELVKRHADADARRAVARAHSNVARALAGRGEREQALAEIEEAARELEGLGPEVARELGELRSTEGMIRFLGRDVDGAREALEAAGELLRSTGGAPEAQFQVKAQLADVEMVAGNAREALERYTALRAHIDKAPIPETQRAYLHAKFALKQGNALSALDRDDEAARAYAESASITARLSRDDPDNAALLYDHAVALSNQVGLVGGDARSIELLQEAIALMTRAVGSRGSDNVEWLGYLGSLNSQLGRLLVKLKRPGARAALTRAVDILGSLDRDGKMVEIENHRAALEAAREALSDL